MRLDFGQIFLIFFFPTVMHQIFKKHRHYFPIPLSIRESFREIAARRKRVKLSWAAKQLSAMVIGANSKVLYPSLLCLRSRTFI